MNVTCLVDCRNTLGEGCVWDPRSDSLYWTDIEERRIFRLAGDGMVSSWPLRDRAGFILPRRDPGFVIGFADCIALADPEFRSFTILVPIETDLPQTRVNDAAVDPFGGIVFGTFDERDRQPSAGLYRLAPTGELTRLLHGITISNGIAFSPDGATMYFADTPVGIIRRFKVGPAFATFEEVLPLAGAEIAPGNPDGAIVDQEGCYWNARVWGGCLAQISPEGRLMQTVTLPTKGPTCVALGGTDGKRLFATTLRLRHSGQELADTPVAGGLFGIDVAVPAAAPRLCVI